MKIEIQNISLKTEVEDEIALEKRCRGK